MRTALHGYYLYFCFRIIPWASTVSSACQPTTVLTEWSVMIPTLVDVSHIAACSTGKLNHWTAHWAPQHQCVLVLFGSFWSRHLGMGWLSNGLSQLLNKPSDKCKSWVYCWLANGLSQLLNKPSDKCKVRCTSLPLSLLICLSLPLLSHTALLFLLSLWHVSAIELSRCQLSALFVASGLMHVQPVTEYLFL